MSNGQVIEPECTYIVDHLELQLRRKPEEVGRHGHRRGLGVGRVSRTALGREERAIDDGVHPRWVVVSAAPGSVSIA